MNIENDYKVLGWSYSYLEKKIVEKFGRGTAKVGINKKKNIFDDLTFYDGFDMHYFYKGIKEGYIYYDPGTNEKKPYSQMRFRYKGIYGIDSISYKKILTM